MKFPEVGNEKASKFWWIHFLIIQKRQDRLSTWERVSKYEIS